MIDAIKPAFNQIFETASKWYSDPSLIDKRVIAAAACALASLAMLCFVIKRLFFTARREEEITREEIVDSVAEQENMAENVQEEEVGPEHIGEAVQGEKTGIIPESRFEEQASFQEPEHVEEGVQGEEVGIIPESRFEEQASLQESEQIVETGQEIGEEIIQESLSENQAPFQQSENIAEIVSEEESSLQEYVFWSEEEFSLHEYEFWSEEGPSLEEDDFRSAEESSSEEEEPVPEKGQWWKEFELEGETLLGDQSAFEVENVLEERLVEEKVPEDTSSIQKKNLMSDDDFSS